MTIRYTAMSLAVREPCRLSGMADRRINSSCGGRADMPFCVRALTAEFAAPAPADVPGWRILEVEAGRAGERAELVADARAVHARGLLRNELARLAAQGVAEHSVYHRFRQCAEPLQRFG